jgi:hypothetical protein
MLGHFSAALYVIYLFRKRTFNHMDATVVVPELPNKQQNNNLGEQL